MNKDNLDYIKRQIDLILRDIYNNRDKLRAAKRKLENGVIINGKFLGQDKIENDLYRLDTIIDNLINVRNRCNQKIDMIERNTKFAGENFDTSNKNSNDMEVLDTKIGGDL